MLIARIAGGDRLAMQTLFARHRTAVYRWLLRLVGNEATAEDLLSDVFLDVWRQADRFQARSSVSTWLMAIARFKALSARRVRKDAELDETIEATVADPADDPEVMLEKKNRDALVREALTTAVARTQGNHRPRLLSREVGRRMRADPRRARRHREDPHVLCPQENGGDGQGGLSFLSPPIARTQALAKYRANFVMAAASQPIAHPVRAIPSKRHSD